MGRRFDDRLIPPGINDARVRYLWGAFDVALAGIELSPRTLLMRTSAEMTTEMLPLAVWELSLDEFMPEEGLPEHVVRRLIDRAYELHALKGTDEGVKLGMQVMLGGRADIVHWWQRSPRGHHDTHTITVWIGEAWDGVVMGTEQQRAALRMIDATKRWSQETDFRVGVLFRQPLGTAAVARGLDADRETISAGLEPVGMPQGTAALARGFEADRALAAGRMPATTASAGAAAVLRGIEVDRRTLITEVH